MHEMGDDVPRFEKWEEVTDEIYQAFRDDFQTYGDAYLVRHYETWADVRDAVDFMGDWAAGLGVAEDGPFDWVDKTTESMRDLFAKKVDCFRKESQDTGWLEGVVWADRFFCKG